jgi:hypothetical protein
LLTPALRLAALPNQLAANGAAHRRWNYRLTHLRLAADERGFRAGRLYRPCDVLPPHRPGGERAHVIRVLVAAT